MNLTIRKTPCETTYKYKVYGSYSDTMTRVIDITVVPYDASLPHTPPPTRAYISVARSNGNYFTAQTLGCETDSNGRYLLSVDRGFVYEFAGLPQPETYHAPAENGLVVVSSALTAGMEANEYLYAATVFFEEIRNISGGVVYDFLDEYEVTPNSPTGMSVIVKAGGVLDLSGFHIDEDEQVVDIDPEFAETGEDGFTKKALVCMNPDTYEIEVYYGDTVEEETLGFNAYTDITALNDTISIVSDVVLTEGMKIDLSGTLTGTNLTEGEWFIVDLSGTGSAIDPYLIKLSSSFGGSEEDLSLGNSGAETLEFNTFTDITALDDTITIASTSVLTEDMEVTLSGTLTGTNLTEGNWFVKDLTGTGTALDPYVFKLGATLEGAATDLDAAEGPGSDVTIVTIPSDPGEDIVVTVKALDPETPVGYYPLAYIALTEGGTTIVSDDIADARIV